MRAQRTADRPTGRRLLAATLAILWSCAALSSSARAQCFSSSPVAGFSEERVGGEVVGAARLVQGLVELCSSSGSYGGRSDALFTLAHDATSEFELSVEVVDVEGAGLAGLEARVFRGTGSDPAQAVVRISVEPDATGIGFVVVSSVRTSRFGALQTNDAQPVPVELPVRLGIERRGDQISTSLTTAQASVEHLTVGVEPDSSLDSSSYRVSMVHGSGALGQEPPRSAVAVFRDPVLVREPSVRPPSLSSAVEGSQATVDLPSVVTIKGTGLSETLAVTVAGLDATILARTDSRLTVEVPATGRPLRGDIVVRTPGGVSEIPNAFHSFGESFIRCDCNGDGDVDLSDMIRMLSYLFLGDRPCECAEAGDCNGDDDLDPSDPISGLTLLFVDAGRVPPAPYPEPGTDPTAPMCGVEEQLPRLTGISRTTIREGDEFTVSGSGLGEGVRIVIPGARLEVLEREADRITLRAGKVTLGGSALVGALPELDHQVSSLCRPRTCASTSIGPMTQLEQLVELEPSTDVPVVGATAEPDVGGAIVLKLERQLFDPARPLEVSATLVSPPIANVSPGARVTEFQLSPERTFEDTVVALADRLRLDLGGGAHLTEAYVLPDPERGCIVFEPTEDFPATAALAAHVSIYAFEGGRCGPDRTHPVLDEREHAWCRLEELVEPCNGLPAFEWHIPLSYVKSKSSSLGGLPHPSNRAPHDKEILYNWEAYCHVRRYRLWNLCTLERLVGLGRTDIPDFPVGAWVTKTLWRTADELPAGIDPSKLYSYVYNGDGETYYLTAIHHMTKDIDRWFWYDLYPSEQVLEGGKGDFVRGIGGCGGTDVDAPDWTTETVWDNYLLCTNVTNVQPISTSGVGGVGPTTTENSAWCGNFEFATECPDIIDAANLDPADDCFAGDDTCLNCHQENSLASVAGATLGVDYLHSLKSAVPEPYPCRGDGGGPVTWVTHVEPIITNNCSCHSNWMAYETLVNAPSTRGAPLVQVKPNDLANSFLWRKVTNTHLAVCGDDPAGDCNDADCGCAMPRGSYPLPDWQLDTIEAWILGGAPYD